MIQLLKLFWSCVRTTPPGDDEEEEDKPDKPDKPEH